VAPQRPPHVPHTQAAYAGASSGNPTSASLSLALDGFIPPLELVDPAAPHLLPQPQEATEPSRPPSGTSRSSFAPGAADGRARPGPNCLKNCRWCKRPWHKHDGVKRGTRCPFALGVAGGGGVGGG